MRLVLFLLVLSGCSTGPQFIASDQQGNRIWLERTDDSPEGKTYFFCSGGEKAAKPYCAQAQWIRVEPRSFNTSNPGPRTSPD